MTDSTKAPDGYGITCPTCGSRKNRTLDCRPAKHGQMRRRKKCDNSHTFATFENVDE